MPDFQEVPFSGLVSREYDERVPFDEALLCDDCWTDRDGIEGRSGYRPATAAAVGSGTVQAIGRFRPNFTQVRTIVVRGGHLYQVSDPTTETASDGVVTEIICSPNPPFGANAKISLAQFGKYMYVASDLATDVMQRIHYDASTPPNWLAEAFAPVPKPAAPTVTTTPLQYNRFQALPPANVSTAGGASAANTTIPDWIKVDGPIGATLTYDLGADLDASSIQWLFVSCSPSTQGGGGGLFRVEVATAGGSFESVSDMTDTPGNDSPYALYGSLIGLTSLTRQTIRRIRFTQVTNANSFWVAGWMFAPTAPGPGQVIYYITYYNSTTGQESALSDPITIVYSSDGITFPQFQAARSSGNSFISAGANRSTNPDSFDASSLYNKGAGKDTPNGSSFSPLRTFTNATTMPPGNYDTVRLWRVTPAGTRLVKAVPATPGAAPGAGYTVTDNTGDATLSHQSYVAGGAPSPAQAMAAVGGRLVTGGDPANPPRLNISSYLAFGQVTDPFPQWPPIPTQTQDGSSFDIAPTNAEQILWLGNGDLVLYIGTNEAMYSMSDLTPSLTAPYNTPTKIWVRGVIGRQAATYVERALYWVAHDGIYVAQNRVSVEEMTRGLRNLFRSWFAPDATTVLAYKDRKLLAVTGQRMLRYDFVTGRWSRHNLGHAQSMATSWRDPVATIYQLWFFSSLGQLYRWQPGTGAGDPNRATTDGGTAIPSWTYQTGYVVEGSKQRVKGVLMDRTGSVTLKVYKDATINQSLSWTGAVEDQKQFTPTIQAYKLSVQLTGANLTTVRRLLWQRQATSGEGE